MCGRFTLRTPAHEIAKMFGVTIPSVVPRYNVSPTQQILSIVSAADSREAKLLRWGLVPFWAKDLKIGNTLINARAESVRTKPSFRSAFKSRRCLIVADGFYEWQKRPDGKQPFRIHRKDDQPFGFAGLWERWGEGTDLVESATIITTTANDLMRTLHDRMPVILAAEDYDTWLRGDPDQAEQLLRPAPNDVLDAYPVSRTVNSPKNDVPECVLPISSHETP